MKKSTLIAGFLVLAFVATLSVSQTASALSLGQIFGFGKSDKTQEQTPEETGQVLSAQTEDQSKNTDQKPGEEASTATEAETPTENIIEVVKGDSLSKIAKAHNTTYKRLFDANPSITDPNIINPGDKIRIPSPEEQLTSRDMPVATPKPVAAPKATTKKSKPTTKSPTQPVASSAPAVASGSVWDRLAQCESGGNWSINTGNGYYGGLQFTASTWRAVGGSGLPHQNSREEQIKRAEILLARSGWGQWPACTKKLGLR